MMFHVKQLAASWGSVTGVKLATAKGFRVQRRKS
jgi:hypothetical protein